MSFSDAELRAEKVRRLNRETCGLRWAVLQREIDTEVPDDVLARVFTSLDSGASFEEEPESANLVIEVLYPTDFHAGAS